MSMRARVLAIGLFALGHAAAQATAPQIVDPGEDLFDASPKIDMPKPNPAMASKPDQMSPSVEEPSTATKPAQPSRAEPELPANPLWAIPLSRLSETRNRPPFSPSRRPPQPVAVAKPVAPAAPPPKPPEPVMSQLSLVGTIVGARGGIGLFFNAADKSTIRLRLGENHKGWVLRAVASHQAELANGLDRAVLKLPPPDMKSVVGAPPPAYAAAPQAASMPLPVSNPSDAAKIGVQPTAFDPSAPGGNPFAEALARARKAGARQ